MSKDKNKKKPLYEVQTPTEVTVETGFINEQAAENITEEIVHSRLISSKVINSLQYGAVDEDGESIEASVDDIGLTAEYRWVQIFRAF